ncbi:hypothetical protein [Blautia pseudococcoides]|uniref:hypothetical protein n=1 Tax=Blautia pseudococcoides TaxID=1796616 RepID=UPI003A7F10B3
MTNFIFQHTYTIGIETLEGYRRKGYCQIPTEAFISELLQNVEIEFCPYLLESLSSQFPTCHF